MDNMDNEQKKTDQDNTEQKKTYMEKTDQVNTITKTLTRAALIAALYAALTIFVMPISYGVMQFRVSEALTVLPVFTPAAIPGLFVGCLVANIVSPVGLVDVIIGSAATLLAALLTYLLREHRLLALLPPVLTNAILVGTELYYFYNVDFSLPACMFWVGLGEMGACYLLGYPLSLLLDKHKNLFK